jgi:cyclopropane-fatty-acyl-phospholipid synthase
LGEAYIFGDYDVEGDMESAVAFGLGLMSQRRSAGERLHLHSLLSRLPRSNRHYQDLAANLKGAVHSKTRDRAAIHYHYDISNDFYQLFLDSRMMYSGGYFDRSDEDLDAAQEHKLERICRSLELQPGERLLDIGSGWGGLIIYAAQKFGVEALGITLSHEQAELARERVRRAGLESRCSVEICDYRDVGRHHAFEKISSIGMVEHVGARELPRYFADVHRLLAPGGIFLNSGIGRPVTEPAQRRDSFVETYVFPDGELETISETLRAAEDAGFEVSSVENLGEHYAQTLRHWVRRLEDHADTARQLVGEVTYRIWRLYMAGSAARFTNGGLHLFQTVLRKTA